MNLSLPNPKSMNFLLHYDGSSMKGTRTKVRSRSQREPVQKGSKPYVFPDAWRTSCSLCFSTWRRKLWSPQALKEAPLSSGAVMARGRRIRTQAWGSDLENSIYRVMGLT